MLTSPADDSGDDERATSPDESGDSERALKKVKASKKKRKGCKQKKKQNQLAVSSRSDDERSDDESSDDDKSDSYRRVKFLHLKDLTKDMRNSLHVSNLFYYLLYHLLQMHKFTNCYMNN